jgi:hypothetical protein
MFIGSVFALGVGAVQMFSGREFLEWLKMIRPQRLRNLVFFTEPFAQINQAATFGTERAELS